MDPVALDRAVQTAAAIPGMRSLLIARHGELVSESYFNGVTKDSIQDVRSVTKSFTSALVGIALREGLLQSTEQTVGELLGGIAPDMSPEWSAVTLDDLLTMRAGHDWHEIPGPSEFNEWVLSPNQVEYVLAKEIVSQPGTRFNYSDGSAHLVAVALAEAAGMPLPDFAGTYLFAPMGIAPRVWLADQQGYAYGGVALYLTGRDMLALGQLYLDGGLHDGVQVVPADWVARSTASQTSTRDAVPYGTDYGYYWWSGSAHGHDYYFANGYGGQFIVVVPDLDLVVTAACTWWSTGGHASEYWYRVITVIMEEIIPAAR
ncbi:MAG: serine hydrolase [Gemmatimonadota bacterium]